MRDKILSEIESEIEKIRRKYKESAEEIVSGYNRENSLSKDYEGRQIYELLQNADDESEGSSGKVLIEFDGKRLTVSNTGDPFSFQGIKSLLYPNASPKRVHTNKIGSKGLGFRSILTWANCVTVASDGFTIQFSKEYASDFLAEILKKNPDLADEIRSLTLDENPIATLSCPKILNESALIDGYSTSIIVDCKEGTSNIIIDQIKNLEFEELIFLPNLQEIEIRCNNYHKSFCKIVENSEAIIETIDHLSGEKDCAIWELYKKSGTIFDENNDPKGYEFIIAYDPTGEHSGEVLYSYFKTDVKMMFPALIHGTFELTSDRNSLQKGSIINTQLVDILSDFLVDTAVEVSLVHKECNYEPLRLIISTDMDIVLMNTYHLDKLLKNKAKEKSILPTISGKYISVHDNPIYSPNGFDKVLNPDLFGNLLLVADDEHIAKYIQEDLGIEFYTYINFCKKINGSVAFYSIEKRVELIRLIKLEYSYEKSDSFFPHLLEDSKGRIIDDYARVYPLPIEEKGIDLPEWVEIRFLSIDMEKMLYKALGIGNNRRELSKELARYNLEEYSFDRLLHGIVNQVDSVVNSIEKCKDIINWLWKYYDTDNRQTLNDIKVKVICRDGSIRYANECYLGKEYDNELGERLISVYSNNFVSSSCFDLGDNDIILVASFFEWIGVAKFPRLEKKTLTGSERNSYLKYCDRLYVQRDNYSYPHTEFTNIRSVIVGCYEQFELLLDVADFNDILAWFVVDEHINSRLSSITEEKNPFSCITGWPPYKQDERRVAPANMKSYIRWVLSKKEWIPDKNGLKKQPNHCCFDDASIAPVVIVPNVDYAYIKSILGRNCKKEVDAILSRIGVSDAFQEMDKCVIYDVLLELHSLDPECKKGKSIYRKMIRDGLSIDEYIEDNPSYQKFLRQGTVLVKKDNTKKYVPISDAYYADRKVFSREILKSFNMFDADNRSGEEKIKKLFGVKPLKYSNVSVYGNPTIHFIDDEFKKEYLRFLPFVYACRIERKNAMSDFRRLKSTRITICSQIKIQYSFENNTQVTPLEKYETVYLRSSNAAYIQVPNEIKTIEELRESFDFADAIAELITAFLDVNEDKDFYRDLFRDSIPVREKKMRIDRNDDNLELLSNARKQFNTEVNLKDEFWLTMTELMRLGTIPESNTSDIIHGLGVSDSDAAAIHYDNLSALDNIPRIIELFQFLDIDIPAFNSLAVHTIDIRTYWKNEFNEKMRQYRTKYQAYLFELLKDEKNNAECFDERLELYDIADPLPDNSIHEDVEKLFKNEFGVSFTELDPYSENETETVISSVLGGCDQSVLNVLESHFSKSRINSFALFNRIQDLLKSLDKPENGAQNEMGSTDIQNVINDVLSSAATGFSEVRTLAQTHIEPVKAVGNPRHLKKKHSEGSDLVKLNTGIVGEATVFKELKQIYPSTRWVSGNAEKAGSISKGDDTCGYDISYMDEYGILQYVEVKASRDNDIVFYLSDNELKFACDHANVYEVIFVHIGDEGKPIGQPWRLGHLFEFADGEDLLHNERFTIESNNYTITATTI